MPYATYGLTPEQRAIYSNARARALSSRADNMRSNRAYTNQVTYHDRLEELKPKVPESNEHWANRAGEAVYRAGVTVWDFLGEIIGGAFKTVEGLMDFGAGVVGLFGDDDFKDEIQHFIERDQTREIWHDQDWYQKSIKDSYITGAKGENIVRGVGQGIGQVGLMAGVAYLSAGLGAAGSAAGFGMEATSSMLPQLVPQVFLALSAGGRGVESAFQEGAGYGEAMTYGALSGAVEVAIERISGGVFEKVYGKGVIDGAVNNVLSKATQNATLRRGLKTFMDVTGEGVEEMIAEVIDPYLKRITYDKNADPAKTQEILEAGLIGALTSLAFQGTIGQINRRRTNVQSSLAEYQTYEQKKANLHAKGQLTDAQLNNINLLQQQSLDYAESNLRKMEESRRIKLFSQNPSLFNYFEYDGTKKTIEALNLNESQRKSVTMNAKQDIVNKLIEGKHEVGEHKNIKLHEFKPEHEARRREILKRQQKLAPNVALYFVDGLNVDGVYDYQGNIYLNADTLNASDLMLTEATQIHEIMHTVEGNLYGELMQFLVGKTVSLENFLETARDYNISEEKARHAYEIFEAGTERENRAILEDADIKKLKRELTARYAQDSFTNEAVVKRIVAYNRNKAVMIYNALKRSVKKIQAVFGAEKGQRWQAYKDQNFVFKMEKVFAKALSQGVPYSHTISATDREERVEYEEENYKSKWTKKALIQAMVDINPNLEAEVLNQYTVVELKDKFLHNPDGTAFYIVNERKVDKLTNEQVAKELNLQWEVSESRGSNRAEVKFRKTNERKYTFKEAQKVVDEIYADILQIDVSKGVRKSTEQQLWKDLNSKTKHTRKQASIDLATHIVETQIFSDILNNPKNYGLTEAQAEHLANSMKKADAIRAYQKSFNLEGLPEAQLNALKRDSALIIDLWGKGQMSATEIASQLNAQGVEIKATNAIDILKQVDAEYNKVLSAIHTEVSKHMGAWQGQINQIADTIQRAYKIYGQPTANNIKKLVANQIVKRQKNINKIIYLAELLSRRTDKRYQSASLLNDSSLNVIMDKLTKITKWGNLANTETIRKVMTELNNWYTESNPLLIEGIDPNIKEMLEQVASGNLQADKAYDYIFKSLEGTISDEAIRAKRAEITQKAMKDASPAGELTAIETQYIADIMEHFNSMYQTYSTVFWKGKRKATVELGNEVYTKTKEGLKVRKNARKHVLQKFFINSLNPDAVFRYAEGYVKDGFLKEFIHELQKAETQATVLASDTLEDIENFIKKKKFNKKLSNTTVNINGYEMPLGTAISLYQTLRRPHSWLGLFASGFVYYDKRGKKHDGFKMNKYLVNGEWVALSDSQILDVIVETKNGNIEILEQHMKPYFEMVDKAISETKHAKEFIALLDKAFENVKEIKLEADIQNFGISNIEEDFYFPITRYEGAVNKKDVISGGITTQGAKAFNNLSANKDVKRYAMNQLAIRNAYDITVNHVNSMTQYATMYSVLKTFEMVYDTNLGTTTDQVRLRNLIKDNGYEDFHEYVTKLFNDIQGIATEKTAGQRTFEKLRSAYAVTALAFGFRVMLTQFASYFAAGTEIKIHNLARAFLMKPSPKDMDKWCDYARIRNKDYVLGRALTLNEKLSKVGEFGMKGISLVDRFTLTMLWNASQLEIQSQHKYKVGTDMNKQLAGELLDRVIRTTQANFVMSSRSAYSRSNPLVSSFTMFMSEPTVFLSTLTNSYGEMQALQKRLKLGDNISKADLSKARNNFARATTSVLASNVYYALLIMLFKYLTKRERRDKEGEKVPFMQDFSRELIGAYMGMFPFIRDVYDMLSSNFDIDTYSTSMLTDVVKRTKSLFELVISSASGEPVDDTQVARIVRDSVFAVSTMAGVPTRNMYKLVRDTLNTFDYANSGTRLEGFFKTPTTRDIAIALKEGDIERAETLSDIIIDKRISGTSPATSKVIIDLYKEGHNVLPKTVKDKIVHDNETYELTKKQQREFKAIYEGANNDVNKMLKSEYFKRLTSEQKAYAIRLVYNTYYDLAKRNLIGTDVDTRLITISTVIPIKDMAVLLAQINAIKGANRKEQIARLLLAYRGLNRYQKVLLMAYLGYNGKASQGEIIEAMRRLRIPTAQQKALKQVLGIE